MERSIFMNDFHPSLCEAVKYGEGDCVPIDQTPARPFNIDPLTGRPMSDLTALMKAQPLDRERILANMEEFRADYLPDDMSDEDALKFAQPRLAQMPSELAELAEFIANKKLEEKKKAQELEFLKKLDEEAVESLRTSGKKEDKKEVNKDDVES